MNDQVCKSVFLELPVFPVRRQVTAVCNGGIKNWSCMQRKGCGAQGDRRNVPYEKLKETGDEARARLPCLPNSSTSQQCACSRRKHVVLPVKVSGFLWACVQLTHYTQLCICVRQRAGPSSGPDGRASFRFPSWAAGVNRKPDLTPESGKGQWRDEPRLHQ